MLPAVDSVDIFRYALFSMRRVCRNLLCKAVLPENVHWAQLYCGPKCKKIGPYSTQNALESNDPVELINQEAIRRGARFLRFGFRSPGKRWWFYYPGGNALALPIDRIPPLPAAGRYRCVLFDENLCLMPSEEFSVHLSGMPLCKLSEGSIVIRIL